MSDQHEFFAAALAFLERAELLLPPTPEPIDWDRTVSARWSRAHGRGRLVPIAGTPRYGLDDLLGIDLQKERVDQNTRQFLAGLPANDVLLWGPRGTGKSTLIKALIATYHGEGLRAVEVDRLDLESLPEIVAEIDDTAHRFILFCDDLSFEHHDVRYKALKVVLDGGLREKPENVRVYATSNRRHLLPESMRDNEGTIVQGTELHYGEAVEEKISLSDRFGVWLAFHPFNQQTYLDIVEHWLDALGMNPRINGELAPDVTEAALQFALERGSRSGRTAFQFANDFAGRSALATDAS